jgi:hypothetical protein
MKLRNVFLFLTLIVVFSVSYNYQNTFTKGPISKHSWRQADVYSMTLNYFHEDISLFEPRMHFQDSRMGKGCGEFPLIYYLNSQLWKLTGVNNFTLRFVNFLILVVGMFYLFRISKEISADSKIGLILVATVLSSPLVSFYGNTFLMNIPSLSLMFIAWYYGYKYLNSSAKTHLFLFVMLATLSGLLRVTMLIGLVPAIVFVGLNFFDKSSAKIKLKYANAIVALTIPFGAALVWMYYAKWYNDQNSSSYFLTQTRSIFNESDVAKVWDEFVAKTLSEFYPIVFLGVLALLLISITVYFFKRNGKVLLMFLSLVVVLSTYFLMWYSNFNVHDYYLIEFLLLIPPTFWLANEMIKNLKFKNVILGVYSGFILLILLPTALTKTRLKYNTGDAALSSIYLSSEEVDLWKYFEWQYKLKFEAFETLKPHLRAIGINREDKIVSLGDPTPNLTLSLVDCKGFTDLYFETLPLSEKLEIFKSSGAKYVLTNEDDMAQQVENLNSFVKLKKIENVTIFKY